ncbi:hypothetical protein TNCV_4437361 [Trichonephila clavipes]|nr:hypothetical protein TNCV_4437361 [Trichonephila clavipes]
MTWPPDDMQRDSSDDMAFQIAYPWDLRCVERSRLKEEETSTYKRKHLFGLGATCKHPQGCRLVPPVHRHG